MDTDVQIVKTFREFMEKTGISVVDICAETHIHPGTIYRFLNEKPVNRRTRLTLEQFMSKKVRRLAG